MARRISSSEILAHVRPAYLSPASLWGPSALSQLNCLCPSAVVHIWKWASVRSDPKGTSVPSVNGSSPHLSRPYILGLILPVCNSFTRCYILMRVKTSGFELATEKKLSIMNVNKCVEVPLHRNQSASFHANLWSTGLNRFSLRVASSGKRS